MKLINMIKSFAAPNLEEQLARLDAHLLADIGFNTSESRTTVIRIPAEMGVRLV